GGGGGVERDARGGRRRPAAAARPHRMILSLTLNPAVESPGRGWRDRPTDGVTCRRNCVAGRATLHTWPGGAGEHEGERAHSQPEPPRRAEREEAAGRRQGRAAYRAHGMRALRRRLLAADVAARAAGRARSPGGG